MHRPARFRSSLLLGALVAVSSSCGLVLGVGDFEDAPAAPPTGTGGGAGEGGMGPGGAGGAGGAGGSGGMGTGGVGGMGPGPGDALWSHSHGGIGVDWIEAVAVDTNDDIVVTGFFEGTINFGTAPADALTATVENDFFVAKFTSGGEHLWSKRFGDSTNEVYLQMVLGLNGDIFLGGRYKDQLSLGGPLMTSVDSNDVFVGKLTKDGDHVWSRSFGDMASADLTSLAVAADGNLLATGQFNGTMQLDPDTLISSPQYDVFVSKIDAGTGTFLWSKSFSDGTNGTSIPGSREATGIGADAAGNIVVAGHFTGSVDFGLGGPDASWLDAAGLLDGFVVKLDGNGSRLWSAHFHGLEDEVITGLAVDSLGAVAVAGIFSGTTRFDGATNGPTKSTAGPADSDIFLVKLTPNGNHAWGKQFGDTAPQQGVDELAVHQVAIDKNGHVIATGGYRGAVNFGGDNFPTQGDLDIYLAKFEGGGGAHLWSKSFGNGAAYQAGTALATERATGAVVLGAVTDGQVDLDNGPLAATGFVDVVLGKFIP